MANQWLTGSGVPSTGIGQVTDYYRDTVNNHVYYREDATTWVVVPAFTPNPDGIGTTWLHGATAPLTAQGSDGDYFYEDTHKIVYRKEGATWVAKGSLDFIGIYGVQWGNGLGAPANTTPLNNLPAGSFYLDVVTSDIYYKGPSMSWELKGQLSSVAQTTTNAITAAIAAATADHVQTGLDVIAAENARDAALIQSGVYETEALGRAAVADGQAFKVEGSGNVAAYEYRRTNSTTSVLIATYPSPSGVFMFRGVVASGVDLNSLNTIGSYGLLAASTHANIPAELAGHNCTLTVTDSYTSSGRFQIQEITDWNFPSIKLSRLSDGIQSGAWQRVAVTTSQITDLNVTTAKIADSAVTNAKLASNYDYTATITSGSLDTYLNSGGYVIAGTVTNAPTVSGYLSVHRWGSSGQFVLQRYVDMSTPGKIYFRKYGGGAWEQWYQPTPADASVTTAKIVDLAVTTAKLAEASVDATKLSTKYDWVATPVSGDVNDYTTQSGGWMVAGAMTNAPTGSGWLFVHKFAAGGNFILQRWHDFTDPSIFWVRKNYNGTWSAWSKLTQPQVLPKTGKKVICLGDSITENGDYPVRLATLTGATVTNCGFGGSRLAFSTGDYAYLSFHKLADYISTGNYSDLTAACARLAGSPTFDDNTAIAARLAAVDWSTVDYIVAAYGTNDYGSPDVPLGTTTDTTGATFKGAINYAVNKICTAYPNIKILFVSPIWRSRYNSGDGNDSDVYANSRGNYLLDFVDAMKEMSALNKMPCVDMYRTSGINKYNGATLLSDGLHPVAGVGYQRIAEKIAAGLVANW